MKVNSSFSKSRSRAQVKMEEWRIEVDDRIPMDLLLDSQPRVCSSTNHQNGKTKPEVVKQSESLAAASDHRINMDPTISQIITENKSPVLKAHILASARKFSFLVKEASMKKTIVLLLLIATLSLVSGIMEEGLEDGWIDGVMILIGIVVIILFDCMSKYMQELREQRKLDKQLSTDENLLSHGERVINGEGPRVITSTNVNIGWLRMMSKSTYSNNTLTLQAQLDKLNNCIQDVGLIVCILTFIVLFLRHQWGNQLQPESMTKPTTTRDFENTFKKIITEHKYPSRFLIRLLCVSMVGITEVVPFVVSLAIRNCSRVTLSGRATKHDSLGVANMASVTRICTDPFGGFSEDEMEIGMVFMGGEVLSRCTTLPSNIVEALCDGFGTSKEKTFLHWAKDKFGFKKEQIMRRWEILKTRGTNQFEEPCSVLMMGTKGCDMVLHLNGPPKEILSMCKHYYDSNGHKTPIDNTVRRSFHQTNEDMLHTHLTTVAFACKHTDTIAIDEDDLVLVALLGLKNKNKVPTKAQIKECKERGIETVIVSSKKEGILQDIALQCGVITIGGSEAQVITGEVFRKFTDKERLEKVKSIRVLAEATPRDKLLLVETLREKDEVVAFLGQRTDEAPALKEADIGIAMGTCSSIKARESCDIFIQDGSFSDLISMVYTGRYIYHNIQSFLQLVLIMTASSILINLLGVATLEDAPLPTFELVWVNLVVAFPGGYALLTKPSTDEQLVSPSPKRFLITSNMTKNILSQTLYAAVYVLILQAIGQKSIIPYSFILCQFFNLFNSREFERKNFFKGINLHKEFWVAATIFLILQIGLVKVQVILGYGARLTLKLWGLCFLIGFGSWMVDWLGKVLLSDLKCAKKMNHT